MLYWMRVAVRAHENPALDVARQLSASLGCPLLVYHALDERYEHACDRHHRFILEGARDVQRELGELGVPYAFHLARPGHRPPALRELARRARVVVTEDFPLEPLRGWTEALSREAPVWTVDSSCLAPMGQLPGVPERAFQFRARARARWERAIAYEWNPIEGVPAEVPADLPFEPVDLASADLAALVAECEIDHSVAPVPDFRGGTVAGYRRWEEFREHGLARYASRRNDPLKDGTSRLSPYLHYGQVSPFRLAREAHRERSPGATKFLDELLLWREIAWHLCAELDVDPRSWEALPDWARRDLEQHATDPRPAEFGREQLARSRTGDALWDACQDSLRIHGWLHNNLRMTWGKAFLNWHADPRLALRRCFELNDRYALDGRDPASVGGILWCFGALDRPFSPERAILGSVRPRPTEQHARRVDVAALQRELGRPAGELERVAVVGGGIAGLAAARTLRDHALAVAVFDSGRGPGGRSSSRRDDEAAFDHGAQYLTARDPRFARCVRDWEEHGVVARWEARFARQQSGEWTEARIARRRFVGVPRMSALSRFLSEDLDVHAGRRITGLERQGDTWALCDAQGQRFEGFGAVVLALPAPQARDLLAEVDPERAARLSSVEAVPCYALLLRFDQPVDVDWDGGRFEHPVLAWAARDSSKPGRAAGERWVLHSSEDYARDRIQADDRAAIEQEMTRAFASALERPLPSIVHSTVHRWGCARTHPPLPVDGATSIDPSLHLASDSFGESRIETAWLSGVAAAGRLLATRAATPRPQQGSLFP